MAINYEKVGWDTTKFVGPTNMNHMDAGIKAACDGVDAINKSMGNADISGIGDGTAKGAILELNNNFNDCMSSGQTLISMNFSGASSGSNVSINSDTITFNDFRGIELCVYDGVNSIIYAPVYLPISIFKNNRLFTSFTLGTTVYWVRVKYSTSSSVQIEFSDTLTSGYCSIIGLK